MTLRKAVLEVKREILARGKEVRFWQVNMAFNGILSDPAVIGYLADRVQDYLEPGVKRHRYSKRARGR